MKTSVVIDSCAWDYLFERNVDLSGVFHREQFLLTVTREVEIEILAIPDAGHGGMDKTALKQYIADSIKANDVRTTSVFGFATLDPDGMPSKVQVYGGFDQGTFQSEADRNWYASDGMHPMMSSASSATSRSGVRVWAQTRQMRRWRCVHLIRLW